MKKVSIADLKARLSEYLAMVKRGEEILVTDHGKPVAQIVPLRQELMRETRRAELIKAGLLRPGTGELPADFFKEKPPRSLVRGDIVAEMRAERDEGW